MPLTHNQKIVGSWLFSAIPFDAVRLRPAHGPSFECLLTTLISRTTLQLSMQKSVWNSKEVRYAESLKYEDFFARWQDGRFTHSASPVNISEGPSWRCAN